MCVLCVYVYIDIYIYYVYINTHTYSIYLENISMQIFIFIEFILYINIKYIHILGE